MVADKRADITASLPGSKLILELKRDVHPDLWNAPATQLDRFYTRDPGASGYGVFGVFWYGKHRHGNIPKHPTGKTAPKSALELETMLNDGIAAERRSKLRAVVIDVSIPDGKLSAGRIPSQEDGRQGEEDAEGSMARKKRAKKTRSVSHKMSSLRGRAEYTTRVHKTKTSARKRK